MRLDTSKRGTVWCSLLTLILVLCLAFISSKPAVALSVYDYFVIIYDTEFNKDEIYGSEIFYATVDGTATCKKDLPLTVSEGYITSRVVAQHRVSEAKITLKSRYTITIEPFPNEMGKTTEARVVISLKFPRGSQAGTYDIVGELIEAKVQSIFGFWFTVTPYLPSSEEMGSISYMPDDEEGDGGTIVGHIFDLSRYTDEHGIFTGDFIFQSDDGMCQLTINKDTICLTEDGEPLSELTIVEMEDPPAPPEGYNVIGLTYHLGPDGTTFDPPITLTFTYEESLIPDGMAEDDLVIAMWDEASDEWVILEGCVVDPATNTITVPLSHFSAFTILAGTPLVDTVAPSPTAFTMTNLAITPEEANIGEEITISVIITNTGDLKGTYTVILKIDNTVEATGDIPLTGSSSRTVTFTTSKDVAGTYIVSINGLSGTFEVKADPSAITPPTTPPVTPPPEPQAPSATPPAQFNWWLIGGIIAAVATGITVPLLLRRRQRKAQS